MQKYTMTGCDGIGKLIYMGTYLTALDMHWACYVVLGQQPELNKALEVAWISRCEQLRDVRSTALSENICKHLIAHRSP